jgi:ElaB/YqjD/DUF883 family membrane-anchored ribosome-binding protein
MKETDMAKTEILPERNMTSNASWSAVRHDLEVLGSDIAKLGEKSLSDGQEKLSSELDRLKTNLADISNRVGEKGRESVDGAVETIRRHPLTSVAGAFAVGLLLASLSGRRR